jgi:hypothetical protein
MDDLKDVLKEEISRARKQPKRALSLERERRVGRLGGLLADPNCERETFLETLREFGLTDESPEYRQLLSLWRKRHGNA